VTMAVLAAAASLGVGHILTTPPRPP
jgi:hypothetical protein